MTFWLYVYVAASIIMTAVEHYSYEFDFEDMTGREVVLTLLQQTLHYTRYFLTWPLYVLEDIVIWVSNREDDDG